MKSIIFVPIRDYFVSRKRVFIKFLVPMLIAVAALLLTIFFNIGNSEKVVLTFSGFIDTQINIVAILISFSVAIITILVSADNKNIQCLKEKESNKNQYKPVNGQQLSLFQILLSPVNAAVYPCRLSTCHILVESRVFLVKLLAVACADNCKIDTAAAYLAPVYISLPL